MPPKRQTFKRLMMANYTHTLWHDTTPLTHRKSSDGIYLQTILNLIQSASPCKLVKMLHLDDIWFSTITLHLIFHAKIPSNAPI